MNSAARRASQLLIEIFAKITFVHFGMTLDVPAGYRTEIVEQPHQDHFRLSIETLRISFFSTMSRRCQGAFDLDQVHTFVGRVKCDKKMKWQSAYPV